MQVNPFKPTAGKMPPILIGREGVVTDFSEGLANGAGAPGRLMLVSGQRGYGKTVLLVELSRVARSYGWEVIRQTASAGMCERIVAALHGAGPYIEARLEPALDVAGMFGVRLGRVSVSHPSSLKLRNALEQRLGRLAPGKGILLAIDEAQAADADEMVALATAVQEVIGDEDMRDEPDARKRGVALVFAGLPSVVDDLTNDKVLTFLRRAMHERLGDIPLPDVRNAYGQTVAESGLRIDEGDAMSAAKASGGYPYMVQLVGYYMWQSAQRRRSDVIAAEDVERAAGDARLVFMDAVCASAYKGLTVAQRTFLNAMAADWPRPAQVARVAQRTGRSRSWANAYRRSLIDEGVIEAAGQGLVSYAIPHFGEYMSKADAGV